MLSTFGNILAILSALCIVACGGSSGVSSVANGGTAASCGDSSANACTAVPRQMSDYYQYARTITPTLAPGASASSDTFVNSYVALNADGSLLQETTYSDSNVAVQDGYASDGSLSGSNQGSSICAYQPGLQGLALPQYAGLTFTSTSTETCAAPPRLTSTVYQVSMSVQVVAIESVVVPAGTFRATKSNYSYSSTTANVSYAETGTCWIDTTTGHIVQCQWSYTSTPSGQSSPASSASAQYQLIGYQFHGGAAVGAAVQRYAGVWGATYTGPTLPTSGTCVGVKIDATGVVSGQCSDGIDTAGNFSISGRVATDGVLSLQGSNGASFSGSLSTPYSGQGNWSNASTVGSWTMTHE